MRFGTATFIRTLSLDHFNVALSPDMIGETYYLINISGQEVMRGSINQEKMIISVGELNGGIYIFKIGDLSKKVIIQN